MDIFKGLQENSNPVHFDLERKKVVASAGLASLMVLITFANATLLSQKESALGHSQRGIASLEEQIVSEPDVSSNHLGSIVLQGGRKGASLGINPDAVENLRFGYLEGKYAIRTKGGKLSEVEYMDSPSESERPKMISDRLDFIEKNRNLFPSVFVEIRKLSMSNSAADSKEVYELMDKSSHVVAVCELARFSNQKELVFSAIFSIVT